MNHTPGHWILNNNFEIRDNKYGHLIATVEGDIGSWLEVPDTKPDMGVANARLIASAPELLEACQNALGAYKALKTIGEHKELPGYDSCLSFLQNAIAKAKDQ